MKWLRLIPVLFVFASCSKDTENKTLNNNILNECNNTIQNAIVVDNIAAPVGARRYFFACVAAYESLVPLNEGFLSLAGQLRELKPCPLPDTTKKYCLDLVAMSAHTFVSQKLVYKEDSITFFRDRKLKWYKSQLSGSMYKNSIEYGEKVGKHIVEWAMGDTFDQIRGRDFYTASGVDGKWQPTSPDFMKAVEPNWGQIRPALIPAANAFKIPDPEPFSKDKSSRFYRIAKEVYDEVQSRDSNHLLTAKYWDDNTNTAMHLGHVTINILKISPAGHWLSIFSNIARQHKLNLMETAEGYARFAAVIHDAFIACWDLKYRTDYIRPETAIRMLIDSSWVSPIQTPAFPEYPSGHSVVSTSVANVAVHYFGMIESSGKSTGTVTANTSFTDSSEYEFGLGARKFNSITDAAKEACISRLYGGIHFIDAIERGQELGKQISAYHNNHLKTRKI